MKRKTIAGLLTGAAAAALFVYLSASIDNGAVGGASRYAGTFMSLVPPVIAIGLALITKEVYSSLFIGVVTGGLLCANFHPIRTIDTVVEDGLIASLADPSKVGILIFLVLLGIMVALMNKAGGSAAFGAWAKSHVKSKTGAQLATFVLGVLIFVDDYFNCLTVGSVMRPVTDSHGISRAKLAYIIDATAAPICMIAPISSWAAAVSGVVEGQNGLELFIKAIPYNFYSLLTIVMILAISFMKLDYGPMKKCELSGGKAGSAAQMQREAGEENASDKSVSDGSILEKTISNGGAPSKGKIIDLVLPVLVLIICCVAGMVYSGGFFDSENPVSFVDAFANCSASVALSWGALIALIITVIYLVLRGTIRFKEAMECVPKGFVSMVPPILILTFAWTLSALTEALGADVYVAGIMEGMAEGLASLLPAIIFLVAAGLSFATGTSWGTFGILIPIVVAVFSSEDPMLVIGVSACLAGAVCGDHCSPISDTTIMASAGAECNHISHVTTQLPYAMTVAAVSFLSYIIAGYVHNWLIVLPIAAALMLAVLFVIRAAAGRSS